MKIIYKTAIPFAALALMAPTAAFGQAPEGTPNQESNPGTEYQPAETPTAESNPGTAYQPSETPTAESNPGTERRPATPGPNANAKAKRRAYGQYCQGQSRKPVKGERGSAFSRCVTAMAKLANGKAKNPRTACEGLSKKRVEGERGTPFSQCVKGGARLLRDQREQADAEEQESEEGSA